ENLNDPDAGISSNVGKIKGGIGPNTVAQHAKAQLDFRFVASKDNARLEKKIKEICANTLTPGTSSNLEIVSHRPPMPETKENTDLFLKMVLVAQNLGMKIVPQIRNGVSDANIIALAGIPVLDGLGPVGSKDHSKDEYIEKASLLERTILFACFLANS
ncbi:MAG: M20 family metallopeptidase, partial [Desulfobacteraceae bacterium]|nr:M20 family metallopeptidase [Desulfobacteraceae bacterium]